MNIGRRLRELRDAKGWSQGEIESMTGLLRSYISRVENGHTTPSVSTLERFAGALGIELYQLFQTDKNKRTVSKPGRPADLRTEEKILLHLFKTLTQSDQRLILIMIREMAKERRKGKRQGYDG